MQMSSAVMCIPHVRQLDLPPEQGVVEASLENFQNFRLYQAKICDFQYPTSGLTQKPIFSPPK